eukprot:2510169-Prymnesium_polylepis.1
MNSSTPQWRRRWPKLGLSSSKIMGYVISSCASFSRHEGGRMILSEYLVRAAPSEGDATATKPPHGPRTTGAIRTRLRAAHSSRSALRCCSAASSETEWQRNES